MIGYFLYFHIVCVFDDCERGRLSTSNAAKQNFDMEKFKLKKLHNAEDMEQYQIKNPNL
jgi:hypothetical protein